MDALLSIVLLLALAAPVGFAAAWLVVKGPSGLAGFFGPQPGLGWPHGVQEEEPVAWQWHEQPPTDLEPAASPSVQRVEYQVGRGAARRPRGSRRR